MRSTRISKSLTRLACAAAIALMIVAGTPRTAAAHANLIESVPANGSTVATSPEQIELRFTETIAISEGSVAIFDSQGDAIPADTPVLSGDETAVTTVLPDLARGTYVVTWRALSGDSHPIQGAFTFNVGAPSTTAAGLEDRLLDSRGSSRAVGVIYGALRMIVFVGLLVAIGGFAFLVLIQPPRNVTSRARRFVRGAIAVMVAGSLLELLVVGPYFAGGAFGDVARGQGLSDTIGTRLGIANVGRLGIGVAGLALLAYGESLRRRTRVAITTVWAGGAAATLTLSGHPRTGRWQNLAIVTDLVHIVAAGVWIGGLAILLGSALRDVESDDAEVLARRFSTMATVGVVAVVATGCLQAVRQIGSISDLWSSSYGRILLVKVVTVAVIVAVGARSRTLAQNAVRNRRSLRISVLCETAIAAAVVALTAVLVNTGPPRAAIATTNSEDAAALATAEVEDVRFEILVKPAVVGPNSITVRVTDGNGDPAKLFELSATLQPTSETIEPLDVAFEFVDGEYRADGFVIPLAGKWTIALRALTGPIDQLDTTATITIN